MRPARIISALFYGAATGLGIASAWFAYFGKFDIATWCAAMSLLIRFDLFETHQQRRDEGFEHFIASSLKMIENILKRGPNA